jgi:hypothetical protein
MFFNAVHVFNKTENYRLAVTREHFTLTLPQSLIRYPYAPLSAIVFSLISIPN